VSQNHNNKFTKYIKDNFPDQPKLFFKNTIMYFPIMYREFKFKTMQYESLLKDFEIIKEEKEILENILNAGKFEEIEKGEYKFKSLIIPYLNQDTNRKNKKSGYIDFFLDELVIVTGSGKFLYINKNDFINNQFLIKELPSNLEKNELFNNKINWTGVKDIKIINDDVYISITEETKKNCYATSVLHSKFNFKYLNFNNIYRPEQCINEDKKISSFKFFNGYQTGGRLIFFNNNIYLSNGDYNSWEFPQDDHSQIGKIIEIDLVNKNHRNVAKGLRNPQGMSIYNSEKNSLIITDHGPKGGDEINILNLNETILPTNFGWPLASYGEHYDVTPINNFSKKFAPLQKSHSKYNFKEPTYYFKNSVGISEVIKNYYTDKKEFFVTSLKNKSLYIFNISSDHKASLLQEINIGERIRDIIFDEDSRSYFLYLEDSPKIMMFSKKNN
jgi:hypothetical protein